MDDVCAANHFLGHYFFGTNEISEEIKNRINEIKQYYFEGDIKTFDDKAFQSLSNAFTDSGFHYGTDLMAR